MAKWTTAKEGIRYREHETRKHGVALDRYFAIRYRDAEGKRREEALGWASQGWTVKKAQGELARLLANTRTGTGPQSLQESREVIKKKRQEEQRAAAEEARLNTTFADVFELYLIYSKANKRSAKSWKREEQLTRLHILPVFRNNPLRKIAPIHLERLKKNMAVAGQTPRSIRYALAVVRQVFNYAIAYRDKEDNPIYEGENPAAGKKVARPQEDNKKQRYLSREEADRLLKELLKHSQEVHDMALLSLYTGMRFGEVANLRWGDVDLFGGVIILRKTKSAKNRPAYITPESKEMFLRRGPGDPDRLVFPARSNDGEERPHQLIGNTYYHVVKRLFNNGVTDRKQWVDFHTLRHTFASWLVKNDTNIYLVKELLGHSDLKLTERYAHVGENQLKQAVMGLSRSK